MRSLPRSALGRLASRLRTWLVERLRRLDPAVVAGVEAPPITLPLASLDDRWSIRDTAALSAIVLVELASSAERAEDAYSSGLEVSRASGDVRAEMRLHATIAEVRALRGDLVSARDALAAAEEVATEAASSAPHSALAIARGTLLELEGERAAALVAYRDAESLAERVGARFFHTKAAILAAAVDPDAERSARALEPALAVAASDGYRDIFSARPALVEWLLARLATVDLAPGDREAVAALLAPAPVEREGPPPAPERAEFRMLFLGPFELRAGDRDAGTTGWRTVKAKELFAFLALQPSRTARRDVVCERLWPEANRAAAVSNFHFTLHALRREVTARDLAKLVAVAREGSGYRLMLGPGTTCDLDDFHNAVAAALTAKRAGREDDARTALERAVALVRAPFLEDLKGEWLELIRDELDHERAAAIHELAALALRGGEPLAALRWCGSLVARDPFDEDAHRLLIEAYDQAGETVLALRQYQALEKRLRSELGTVPQAETVALAARVRRKLALPGGRSSL